MEKLCNALSEIHLRYVVTLSVSTPTIMPCVINWEGKLSHFETRACWFKSFLEHFQNSGGSCDEKCNFYFVFAHRLLLLSCINNWCKVPSFALKPSPAPMKKFAERTSKWFQVPCRWMIYAIFLWNKFLDDNMESFQEKLVTRKF